MRMLRRPIKAINSVSSSLALSHNVSVIEGAIYQILFLPRTLDMRPGDAGETSGRSLVDYVISRASKIIFHSTHIS